MPKRKSFVGSPLLITHWDPDMYPNRPLPLIPELVIYILAHGDVWIKEVDLFLNSRIAAVLSDPVGFQQFSSLVATKRVKVLIPDRSRDLDDPFKHPILSTANEIVRSKRPLKTRQWRMTDQDRRLCEAFDAMLVANGGLQKNGVVRHRIAPADRNVFSEQLVGVLAGEDKRWRDREQFKAIDQRVAKQFTKYALNHELAIDLLRKEHITPNATNGFYRSLLYQCADVLLRDHQKARRSMKNLGQSVYAHCELDREKAIGAYYGPRVAELPPTQKPVEPESELYRVEVVPTEKPIIIPASRDIGEIVSAVLEECGDSMRGFWAVAGSESEPEVEFALAWEQLADAFARHAAPHGGELGKTANVLWDLAEYVVHGAELLDDSGKQMGVTLIPDFSQSRAAQLLRLGVKGVASFGRPTMEYIRRGRADQKKGKVKKALLDAATARVGCVA
jgi:hypothetical protein